MTNLFQYAELFFFVMSVVLLAYKKNQTSLFFAVYALVVVFVDIIAPYFRLRIGGSNHFLYNIYQPLLFIFFIAVYYKHFQKQWKITALSAALLWFGFFILEMLAAWNRFSTDSFLLACFLIIFFSGVYLLMIVKAESINNLFDFPGFWFAIASLSFFSSMAIIMGGYLKIQAATKPYYLFREIINVLHYLLLSFTAYLLIRGRKWQT